MSGYASLKGVFGKLPAHGDFIQRELPAVFTDTWDAWLQRSVHGSREMVGEAWLDYYLTSPVWRFALAPGVIDERTWSGVLLPSVDSVGRYFPLTLCTAMDRGTLACDALVRAQGWYEQLSDLGINALQESLNIDLLLDKFPEFSSGTTSCGHATTTQDDALLVKGNTDLAQGYATLLESSQPFSGRSHSVWWAPPTNQREAMMMLSPGLPDPQLFATMMGAPITRW